MILNVKLVSKIKLCFETKDMKKKYPWALADVGSIEITGRGNKNSRSTKAPIDYRCGSKIASKKKKSLHIWTGTYVLHCSQKKKNR